MGHAGVYVSLYVFTYGSIVVFMDLPSLNRYRCKLWHVDVAAGRTRSDGMPLVRPHVHIIHNIHLTRYWDYMSCHRIVPVGVIGGFVVQSMAVACCGTCCGFVSSFVKHGLFIHVRCFWEGNNGMDMGCPCRHIGRKP